jgi:prophage antirepressor-like protein
MPNEQAKPWEQQLREAATRAEEEVRRVMTYINDEVVPEVRKNGSQALRAAAEQMQKLAQRMDEHREASEAAPLTPNPKEQPKP